MKLSSLAIGVCIKDSFGHTFLIGDHKNPDYSETVLVSEKIIARRPMDLPKTSYTDAECLKFGSNNYPLTDLQQWLNDNNSGFLHQLSPELQDALLINKIPYSEVPREITYIEAKMFLPSLYEVGIDCPDHTKEGSPLPLFHDFRQRFALPSSKVVEEGKRPGYGVLSEKDSWCYWLRSSHPVHPSVMYLCHSHSPYSFFSANRDYVGVRPICCIDGDLEAQLIDDCYHFDFEKGAF